MLHATKCGTVNQERSAPGGMSARTAEAVAEAMFALSTPSRVRILGQLRERPHTVRELVKAIGMEQSAVSHQLRVLRGHRLVIAERNGRERIYALHDQHVAALLDNAIGHVRHLKKGRPAAGIAARRLRPPA